MKRFLFKAIQFAEAPLSLIGAPLTLLSTAWLKIVKIAGTSKISDAIFMKFGLFPILDDYYQPMINPKKHLTKSLRDDRALPGIDFNVEEQLSLLAQFHYNEKILKFPQNQQREDEYFFNNNMYTCGDSEYLYNIIKHFKPKIFIEIGSGFSTLMASNAITDNKLEDPDYKCKHICIEPYERSWIEKLDIELIKEKVEEVDPSIFQKLEANDILFIDSSHIIRPQGDVLCEYLDILPTLKSGVIVHIHDIFSPKDYPDSWVYEEHLLWNEQYLLEAFLAFNSEFRIIGALNYLAHNHKEAFAAKCPLFAAQKGYEKNKSEPRAFWLIRQ